MRGVRWPGASRGARGRRGTRGQSLVEFALVIPIFLVMLFAVIDIGRVIWSFDNLSNAAREGARCASVHGGSDVTVCPTGPSLGTTAPTGCPSWTPDSKEPTRTQVRAFLIAAGGSATVTVCYYVTTPCTGDTDEAAATNERGSYVKVGVTTRVNLITPALLGMTGFDVAGGSTVLVNN